MNRSGQRDIVYCHQCENEWYREQHGLECPQCHSDFTEIIEPHHDPRDNENVPDPDEDDISGMRFTSGPNHSSVTYTYSSSHGQQQNDRQANQDFSPIFGGFASMLGNIMGIRSPTQTQGMGPNPQDTGRSTGEQGGQQGHPSHHRPMAGPGSPRTENVTGATTVVRMGGGPGFQWRVSTTHGPANYQGGPHQGMADMPPMLQLLFGGPPGRGGMGPNNPFDLHADEHGAQMGPFGPLFASLMNPDMTRGGDAAYSQEHFDRIISQLMEQHATGNAPGPATSEAIESLPKRQITEKDLGEENKAECSICMDEVNLGEYVTELPCHHWFHGDCIRAWLGEHDTCPHCRHGIMPKDGPADSSRPRYPGEAPRHDQTWGQGAGTQNDPVVVPDSPEQGRPNAQRRRSSTANASGSRNGSSNNGSSEGLLSRLRGAVMRDAFGGGSQQR